MEHVTPAPSSAHSPATVPRTTVSRAIAAGPARAFPAFSPDTAPFVAKRGKGAYVIDADGRKYLDFSLAGGRLLFGHAPAFVTHAVKDAVSLGDLEDFPSRAAADCARRVARLLGEPAGWEFRFALSRADALAALAPLGPLYVAPPEELVGSDSPASGAVRVSDESASAFCDGPACRFAAIGADAAVLDGALGVTVLATRAGALPAAAGPWPPAPRLAAAAAVARKLAGPQAPWPALAALAARFRARAGRLVLAGDTFHPMINMDAELAAAARGAGFLLAADGRVRFSAAHDTRGVDRLVAFLLHYHEGR